MSLPDKILIVCFGAVGDITRALPLVARIKKASPQTKIHWAVEPRSRSIIENHPNIDCIHEFFRPGGLLVFIRFLRELRREKFNLVLDLQRHFKSGLTTFATGSSRRIAFNRKNSREFNWVFANEWISVQEHLTSKVFHYQAFGDKLDLPKENKLDFGFCATDNSKEKVTKLIMQNGPKESSKLVGLILGSTWPSRFWIDDYYVRLIKELSSRWGVTAILIGGGVREEIFAKGICDKVNQDSVINLVNKTTLADLISVFQSVGCAIGSDSGPMHIAAGAGTPVISLWGSTSPKRSSPYGSEDLVISSVIGCSPCYKANCLGLNTLCMRDITPDAVLALYAKLLDNQRLVN